MNAKKQFTATPLLQMIAGVVLGGLLGVTILFAIVPKFRSLLLPGAHPNSVSQPALADFGATQASDDARYVANWVAKSGDNRGADFVIVDKKSASVLVFDRNAKLRAWSPVLLGTAPGDDTVPGIGSRPLNDVKFEERTTPAGRFLGQRGYNIRGEDVVWVDYGAAVSMHRVLTNNPDERRLERLATPGIDDNRISYGCINVPAEFFETQISPVFAQRRAMVYVLPEIKPVRQFFGAQTAGAPPGNTPG
jgi:hypothetical protein